MAIPEELQEVEKDRLRAKICASLKNQGFEFDGKAIIRPNAKDKDKIRSLHRMAVEHNVQRSRSGLERHEDELLSYIASGADVSPEKISPRLVLVKSNSMDELLFRYARLHWSIPVSAGYGRRLRFNVYDDANGKLIGIFGLGDPIFGLKPRDQWVGWAQAERKNRLQCVMDLFVLGAIPPYSRLLCGKLVALLSTSTNVSEAFHEKYAGRISRIGRKPLDGRLALLTTTSALGRSSLYRRLRYKEDRVFESVGYTRGSGEFHFSNGVYEDLRKFALENCDATAKNPSWGAGFRNRRELVRKTLPLLGLSKQLFYHGIEREIFVAPLAGNSQSFLRGEHDDLNPFGRSSDKLFEWFRDRWLLPRSRRDESYRTFNREDYRLWGKC